jgi:hypothetical protein
LERQLCTEKCGPSSTPGPGGSETCWCDPPLPPRVDINLQVGGTRSNGLSGVDDVCSRRLPFLQVDKVRYLTEYYQGLKSCIDIVTDTIDRKFAKRVVLSTVGAAPFGVRDLGVIIMVILTFALLRSKMISSSLSSSSHQDGIRTLLKKSSLVLSGPCTCKPDIFVHPAGVRGSVRSLRA